MDWLPHSPLNQPGEPTGVIQIQSQKTEKAGDKICSCFHLFFSHWIFITGQEETLRTLSQDRGLGGESSSSPSKT